MKKYTVILNRLVSSGTHRVFNTEFVRVETDNPRKIVDHLEESGNYASFIIEGHPRLEGEIGEIKNIETIP